MGKAPAEEKVGERPRFFSTDSRPSHPHQARTTSAGMPARSAFAHCNSGPFSDNPGCSPQLERLTSHLAEVFLSHRQEIPSCPLLVPVRPLRGAHALCEPSHASCYLSLVR